MNDSSYHRSHASLAAVSPFEDRLCFVWLYKYCPFLNAIERFWLQLKNLAAANRLHRDTDELIYAIDDTISNQNQPDYPDRLDFAQHFQLTVSMPCTYKNRPCGRFRDRYSVARLDQYVSAVVCPNSERPSTPSFQG